jgi:hypothetical protein
MAHQHDIRCLKEVGGQLIGGKSGGRKTKERRFAYHGTLRRHLASIANRGLVPYEASRGAGVWFVDSEKHAKWFGDVMLRFPWPRDAKKTDVMRNDAIYYLAPSTIEPDKIEVCDENKWRPVSDFYDENQ